MSGPRRPRNNRQRVEDYYGVHDTGMGSRPAPAAPPTAPTVPPAPPQGPPPRRVIPPPEVQVAAKNAARAAAGTPPGAVPPGAVPPGAVPPGAVPPGAVPPSTAPQGEAPSAGGAEASRPKRDPLTDPLTSETFQGVQPASDTFEAGVAGGYGYSASTVPTPGADASATSFDAGFDQFAPPRFEPPRFEPRADAWASPASSPAQDDGETLEAVFAEHHEPAVETLDEPDESYIDVEVVDVEAHEAPVAEPEAVEVEDAEPETEPKAEPESETEVEVVAESERHAGSVDEDDTPVVDVADAVPDAAAEPVADAAPAQPEPKPEPTPDVDAEDVATDAVPPAAEAVADIEADEAPVPTEPVAEPPAAETPVEAPVEAAVEEPAPAEPVAEAPVVEAPVGEAPVVEAPVEETAVETPPAAEAAEPSAEPASVTPEVTPAPEQAGDRARTAEALREAMAIDGALGVALVDAQSGMTLDAAGDPEEFDLEVAAAGNSALIRAMGRTLGDLDVDDHIEDILVTLGTQYHIVRPIPAGADDLFLYLVLDRARSNLAMSRFRLTKLAEQIRL